MRHPQAAVVFGGSGAIGGALVQRIAEREQFAKVYVGSRTRPNWLPANSEWLEFDLLDEASIAAAVARIGGEIGLALVATGILHDTPHGIAPEKSWRAIEAQSFARVMAINALGPALIAKHALPRFPREGRAVFAALSARVGSIEDNRLGGWHAYRASKAALNMLVRNLAIELARTHPDTVAVTLHPGTVDSNLSAPFQRGLAAGQIRSPNEVADHLLAVIDDLNPGDSGRFFAWDGSAIPF